MTDHLSDAALAAYSSGQLAPDEAASWTADVHLEGCGACRTRLGAHASPPLLALLGDARESILHEARTGPAPRRGGRWRRWALHWADWSVLSWVVTAGAAILAATLLDRFYLAATGRPSVVLLLAPVAPLFGLTVAWSRRFDPSWESVAGTARAGLDLLLRRTLVVLGTVLPLLAAAGSMIGTAPALWLLPCLAFTAATLLLGGRIGVGRAAVILAGGWLLLVAGPSLITMHHSAAVETGAWPGWAVAAAVLSAVAVLRAGDHRRLASRN